MNEQMRRDWNRRAMEDANFYVAFGRQDQSAEEFFATAAEVLHGLEWEIRRGLPACNPRARRALEIGCGPGRLMRGMSRHFGEIHGVDVSDEMIRRARENLAGIDHAHLHHTSGAGLALFADDSFDFVYSYAVFQHIPDREVIFEYLEEALRVLRPGGLIRAQMNGLPASEAAYDTWSGARIPADEIREFTAKRRIQLLTLEGVGTQYMWTTWRKPAPGATFERGVQTRIRRITNAHSSEPAAPPRGRFASITLWLEDLPRTADLNSLEVQIAGEKGRPTYIGPLETDGLQQLNVILPELNTSGLCSIEVIWQGSLLCKPRPFKILRGAPRVPRIISVTDGINLLSSKVILSGSVKITMEEADQIELLKAELEGKPLSGIEFFTADPFVPRHEVNLRIPPETPAGKCTLNLYLGRKAFAPIILEVARAVK